MILAAAFAAVTAKPRLQAGATRADDLVHRLSDAIITGALSAVTRLEEHAVAAHFAVSRMPACEAPHQHAAAGLIKRRTYRGAVVTKVSSWQVAEMFVAMAEIEAVCARKTALAMTARERHDIHTLHAGLAALVRNGGPAVFITAKSVSNERIYAGAHNNLLAAAARGLRRRLMPYRRAQFCTLGRLLRSHAEHLLVTLAMGRGEAESATRLMHEHLDLVEATYVSFAHAAPRSR